MAFLSPKTLDLGDGDTLYSDLRQRVADVVQFEWFDYRDY
jgi:hypothetical protein